MITQAIAADIMERVFKECQQLRQAGQAEYARANQNALANFERVAAHLGIKREQVLFTYLFKHIDGITAYINGHKSQREGVEGRINDCIVYLCLLRAMVEDTKPDPMRNASQDGELTLNEQHTRAAIAAGR